jgi:hypothetical protein
MRSRVNVALALGAFGLGVGVLGFGVAVLALLRRPAARRDDTTSDTGQ